ncbi:MAG: NAD-dependent epimerase/dehydratase family protein, partial [Clostridiales bacterium]|nr:NAD-dependent epimerase/dehydratase family protein [Clostridiales bacterium]
TLLLGASGFLGRTLYAKLKSQNDFHIIGTYHNTKHDELMMLDVLDMGQVANLIKQHSFDTIIWSLVDTQNEDKLTNEGLKNMLSNIDESTKFVYISTTISTGSNQTENVVSQYRTNEMYLHKYINAKIDGEKLVRKHNNHIIVRPGSIYGTDGFGRVDGRTQTIIDKITASETYSRTANLYSSYVHLDDLSDAIVELIANDFTGTINIAGSKPVSHYEFCTKRAQQVSLDSQFIIADFHENESISSLDTTLCQRILKAHIRNI